MVIFGCQVEWEAEWLMVETSKIVNCKVITGKAAKCSLRINSCYSNKMVWMQDTGQKTEINVTYFNENNVLIRKKVR